MDKAMHSEFDEQRAVVLTNIARPIVRDDLVAAFASDEDLLIYEHFFIRGMEHINHQVSELLEIIDNNNGVHSDSELETIKKCRSIPSESLRSELQKQKEEIANHIAVNSLLTDSEGEADLANKLYRCQSELAKQKELNAELVIGQDQQALDLFRLGDLLDRVYHHTKHNPPDIKKMSYNEWETIMEEMEYYRSESLIKKYKES